MSEAVRAYFTTFTMLCFLDGLYILRLSVRDPCKPEYDRRW